MNWERDGADWPHREASRFITAGGIRWHMQEFGVADAPVCLLLHGTAGATHSWEGLAPLLARRYRVIGMDLPGHGFTERPATRLLSLPGMAGLVGGLCAELNIKPAIAVGHSAGAAIGLQMVMDGMIAPRAVYAINGALMPFKGMAGQVFPMLAKALFVNPVVPSIFSWTANEGRVKRLLESTGSRLSPRAEELYARLFNDPGHVGAALGMMASWDLAALRRRWGEVGVPLHLIVGTADGTIPPSDAREISRGINGALIHPLTGLGHLAHEEDAQAVAAMIYSTAEYAE